MAHALTEKNLKTKKAVLVGEKFFKETGVFQLWEFPDKDDSDWSNYYLSWKNPPENVQEKRAWWFAWNGERLSKCRDIKTLMDHKKEIYDWVVKTLEDGADDDF